MSINELLEEKGITKYRLAKSSGLPHSTVIDICSGRARIEKCSGDTLYKIAKVLDVPMETLVEDAMGRSFPNPNTTDSETAGQFNPEYRPGFEAFKSNICHRVRDMGDLDFVINTLESDEINKLWNKKWYAESLYLLAMVDYLCRENGLPVASCYAEMRRAKFRETLYPAGVLILCAAMKSDNPKIESTNEAIPEFMRFNIVECEVRNVV